MNDWARTLPICPHCDALDLFSLLAFRESNFQVYPRDGEAFTCTNCASIASHTGHQLGVRLATPAEVAAAIEDPLIVETLELIRAGHAMGAL